MTKKHFEAIAKKIKERREILTLSPLSKEHKQARLAGISIIVGGLCDVFSELNDRFDRSRFVSACGIEEL